MKNMEIQGNIAINIDEEGRIDLYNMVNGKSIILFENFKEAFAQRQHYQMEEYYYEDFLKDSSIYTLTHLEDDTDHILMTWLFEKEKDAINHKLFLEDTQTGHFHIKSQTPIKKRRNSIMSKNIFYTPIQYIDINKKNYLKGYCVETDISSLKKGK